MSDLEDEIKIFPPHPAVEKFYRVNPSPTWNQMLTFVINTFPQVRSGLSGYLMGSGLPRYLIEGGVAVFLQRPSRQKPDDVDIILKDQTYDFNMLCAKSVSTWLLGHGLPANDRNIDYLFRHSVTVEFTGKQVYVLDPVALAFSKSTGFFGVKQREKDLRDILLLGVNEAEIREFRKGFLEG